MFKYRRKTKYYWFFQNRASHPGDQGHTVLTAFPCRELVCFPTVLELLISGWQPEPCLAWSWTITPTWKSLSRAAEFGCQEGAPAEIQPGPFCQSRCNMVGYCLCPSPTKPLWQPWVCELFGLGKWVERCSEFYPWVQWAINALVWSKGPQPPTVSQTAKDAPHIFLVVLLLCVNGFLFCAQDCGAQGLFY